MCTILNINTSANIASVILSKNGKGIAEIVNPDQKEHASFLQPAIKKLSQQLKISLQEIDAVSVVNGPGSYTGLRVGLASAKGICFALNKPLITVGSLELMAHSAFAALKAEHLPISFLCPMIDARRMEVFSALYNSSLCEIIPAHAEILSDDSFVATLLQGMVLFFGNGASKFKSLVNHPNALFAEGYDSYDALCKLSFKKFSDKEFTDLAYSEPMYGKEFYDM